MIVHDLV